VRRGDFLAKARRWEKRKVARRAPAAQHRPHGVDRIVSMRLARRSQASRCRIAARPLLMQVSRAGESGVFGNADLFSAARRAGL